MVRVIIRQILIGIRHILFSIRENTTPNNK